VSQTLSTVVGVSYLVEYDYGVTGVFDSDTQSIIAQIFGNDGSTVLTSQTANGTNPPTALAHFQFSFVADGLQSTIRFLDVASNSTFSRDGILDNVSVTSVPEPSGFALVVGGLMGLGWMQRRRARRQSAI
jgi:hypothetical protein